MAKVAIVTGGNKGIGFEIVKGICQHFEGDVYLTARDEIRGLAAVKLLEEQGLCPKFHVLDINNENSIVKFKTFLQNTYNGIDILVNNAAICYYGTGRSNIPIMEQAEKTIATNYTATKNVCDILFPLLKKHARVVNLSSSGGRLVHLNNENLKKQFTDPNLTEEKLDQIIQSYLNDVLNGTQEENGWANPYRISKMALTALTFLQQKKQSLKPDLDIIINAVHPGFVDTDMTHHEGVLTPEKGAEAAIYLALLPPDVKTPRGEFIWHDKTIFDWSSNCSPNAI